MLKENIITHENPTAKTVNYEQWSDGHGWVKRANEPTPENEVRKSNQ